MLRTRPEPAARRVLTAVAVLAMLLGAIGLAAHRRERAPGVPAASDIGVVSTPSDGSSTEPPSAEPTLGPGLLGTHSTVLGAQGSDRTAPTSVAIPRLDLRARTAPTGLDSDGRSLDLPPSARSVVWWAYGASPGATSGTVLLAGHVSWAGRTGVLAGLRRLHVGDRVTVRRQDGRAVTYEVTGRRQVPKMSLAELGLFATGGPARLVLVTCGGTYDPARHSYDDNVVVQARPV